MGIWNSDDPATWQDLLDDYWRLVKERRPKLLEEERWLQEGLPVSLASREAPQLSKEELVRLVRWKLSRGKWRPRLEDFAKQADSSTVTSATGAMFADLGDHAASAPGEDTIRKAIKHTSELKGVGPATGSAILQCLSPSIPFMSDEALEAALGRREYTVPSFIRLVTALRRKAAALNAALAGAADDSKDAEHWTAKQVEQCLFAERLRAEEGNTEDTLPRKRRKTGHCMAA